MTEVDAPCLAGHGRHQADVAGTAFQDRPAPVLPRALAALGRPDRPHGQLNVRVRVVPVRDVDDGQPPPELAVVDVHDRLRAELHRVQVEPGHELLGADDRAEASAGSGHRDHLQHPLVVGELEQVILPLAGRGRRARGLPGQSAERGAVRRYPVDAEAAVVFDVGGPVAAAGCGHQEVRLAHPAASRVGRKAAAQDQRDPVPHRLQRLLLTLGTAARSPLSDDERIRVKLEELRHDLRLEVAPAREQALQERRIRQRLAWPDRVPLRARRALLGDVAALRLGHDNAACRARSAATIRSSWRRSRFASLAAAHSAHASSASNVSWPTPQPNSYQSPINWYAWLASASACSAATSSRLAALVRVTVSFMISPVTAVR